MIKANFSAYSTYVTDSLYQWDINQTLSISGLNLTVAPEVHFSNANMDRAIVRQATLENHVVKVDIPNSLLQEPFTIRAHVGVYHAATFKIVELVEIPVIARTRPKDYQIADTDEEIYSFKSLVNALANKADSKRVDNIIAHNNDTNGNSELVDMRVDADGVVHDSAGDAVRSQVLGLIDSIDLSNEGCERIKGSFVRGGLNIDGSLTTQNYYASSDEPIVYDYDVKIRIGEGYSYKLFKRNADGSYSDTAVKTDETIVPRGTAFLLRIQREPVTYVEANVEEFAAQVYCESYVGNIANTAIKSKIDIDLLKNGDEPLKGIFDRGSLSQGNHALWVKYRVCTPDIISYNRQIDIRAKDGFMLAVHTFDEYGRFTNDSSWLWHKVVDAGTPFKIVIKRVTENTSEIADINEYMSAVRIESGFKARILDEIYNPFRKNYISCGKTPLVGHRGLLIKDDVSIPENSVASFEYAGKSGIWAAEADIYETADGHFVCIHDDTLDRTTTGTGVIANMTLAEIRSVYLKDGGGNATEYVVPTFEEYLSICKMYGMIPLIEIKAISDYEAFFRIIKNYGFAETAMLTGGLWRLDTIRQYTESMLYIVLPTQTNYTEVADTLKGYRSVGVSLLYTNETLTEDVIRQLHERNIFVQLWSINDTDIIKSWFGKGADAIVTDTVIKLD